MGQAGANHIQQFRVVRRLLKECRRSRLQGAALAALRVAGCQNNHWDGRELVVLLQSLQHDKTVASRQAKIKNDQVGTLLVRQRNRGVTIDRVDRIVVVGRRSLSACLRSGSSSTIMIFEFVILLSPF